VHHSNNRCHYFSKEDAKIADNLSRSKHCCYCYCCCCCCCCCYLL